MILIYELSAEQIIDCRDDMIIYEEMNDKTHI